MLQFKREEFEVAYNFASQLTKDHWEEVAKHKDLLRINPDLNLYYKLEEQNRLLVLGAWDGKTLVGYFLWILNFHPHYKDVLVAQEDIYYLDPFYREGWNGYNFLKAAIALAKSQGAQICSIREKVGHERPALLKRLGFKPMDVTYTLEL